MERMELMERMEARRTQGVRTLAGVVLLSFVFSPPLFSADNISGYLDKRGNVVFINDTVITNPIPATAAPSSGGPAMPADTTQRSAIQQQRTTATPRRAQVNQLIQEAARKHSIDPELVHAIVQVESGYNPYAISSKGARGLMQLIPATTRRFGVRNAMDPQSNLDGGIRYLKYLLGMFNGDLQLSLAAYNAGENAVTSNRGVPPYRETRNYLKKIARLYPLDNNPFSEPYKSRIEKFVDARGVMHFSNTDSR